MSEVHGSYYVPEFSAWPIIGSIGLLLFAVGSLNIESGWGEVVSILGALILIFMLGGWFRAVIKESEAGLYDAQMHRTFRWGLFWFLFCEFAFFGTIVGAMIYVRFFSVPWLAGQAAGGSVMTHYILWPNFQNVWPVVSNPAPYLFAGLKASPMAWGIPALNTIIMAISGGVSIAAFAGIKKGNTWMGPVGLLLSIILGIIFLFFQLHYFAVVSAALGLTVNSGIYGSLFFMFSAFFILHVIVGLLILSVVLVRTAMGHFKDGNYFSFELATWFWTFITIIWIIAFIFMF
jgi:cytochrome c oxidase subunit III